MLAIAAVVLSIVASRAEDDHGHPVDTQAAGQHPPTPQEALDQLRVPPGFQVTLAAAEPMVRQPIAIDFDDRGRLWVAECYSYDGSDFTEEKRDRILIFEDADGDGTLEKRTVFQDGLNRLTGLARGFGGVWITAPPNLSWIPDRDGDDRPDGPPVVHLDGWTLRAEHNSVNGLTWGPDGWLYGRHGIKQPSLVGCPGAARQDRVELSCCIWRYHPTRLVFEVVGDGTVNPWGLDFDDHGQAFFGTSVVDHLWHLFPGGHYKRQMNLDTHPDPFAYELMDAACDHVHWDYRTGEKKERVRQGNDAFGGGHSHCDAMIYLGDRWPEEYRGSVFMSNVNGRRINRDTFTTLPSGRPTARHADDFLVSKDPWFRAVSLEYGPDGDVYVTDWSDLGECHDRDGVHRSSGRIYKVTWGSPRRVSVDLASLTSDELADLQLHKNDWYVRHARRLLQERAAAGEPMARVRQRILRSFQEQTDARCRLRLMWALHVAGGTTVEWLTEQLRQGDEHLRGWAVRLLLDRQPIDDAVVATLGRMAPRESSWLVRMELASGARRLPAASRSPIILGLATHPEAPCEPNLERMIWYAMEPLVARNATEALKTADSRLPSRLRRFVARRIAHDFERNPSAIAPLFQAMQNANSQDVFLDLLIGMNESLVRNRPTVSIGEWNRFLAAWMENPDGRVRRAAMTAAVILGDSQLAGRLGEMVHRGLRG